MKNLTEEPKQIKCYCGHTTNCDCSPLEAKQETLELPVEINFANEIEQISEYDKGRWYGRIEGAKWQQEKMYTEKDMKESFIKGALTDLFNTCDISDEDMAIEKFQEWFEQFKKK